MNDSLIISANSHERLFGEAKTRPSRPAQLTLFNNQSAQAKPFSSKQKSSNINQLPGIHNIDLSLEYSSVLSDVRPMHFALIDIWQKSLQNWKSYLLNLGSHFVVARWCKVAWNNNKIWIKTRKHANNPGLYLTTTASNIFHDATAFALLVCHRC